MRLIQSPTSTTVRFSAAETSQFGLPAKSAGVTYDSLGRLDGYSRWLERNQSWEPAIDRLIALADACIPTFH